MTNNDSPGPAQNEAGPGPGRSWRLSELVPDISRRLSRSTTIALLLSPFGILFIAVVRLLIISDYNATTALAVASSGGYVNTLLGSVIPMLPVLMPYLALVLLFFNRVILGLLSLAAAALTSPAAIRGEAFLRFLREDWHDISRTSAGFGLLVLAAIVSILLLILLVTRGLGIFSRSLATICSIILLPVVLRLYPLPDSNSYYAHLVRQPWLPTESISLSSGDSVVGYILSEDQDWVTVLNDRDRHIYYYHSVQIGQRQVCQSSAVPVTLPLISLLPQANPPSSVIPTCNSKEMPAVTAFTVTRGRSQTPPGALGHKS